MTAAELVAALEDRGVELWAEDGELRFRAPAGALTPELRERVRPRRAELLALLAAERPLSASQERIWFLDRLHPGSPAYTIPARLDLSGALSVPALAAALSAVVRRHEALRTRCEERDGRPAGRLEPPAPVPLPVVDLGALPPARRRAEAARAAAARVRRRFDLGAAPLLRPALLRLAAREHALVLATHHLAADGWSMRLLLGELAALYPAAAAGRPAALPAASPFAAQARRERRALAAGTWDGQLDWWLERLAGAEPLELPADRPAPAAPTLRGATLRWHLPAALAGRLEALGREAGATLFMVLAAGVDALLARLTGRSEVTIATAVSNRHRPELERTIGPLSNTLLLRTGLGGDPNFRALAARVAATARAAFAHPDLPYDRLVEALRARSPEAAAAAQARVFLVVQSAPLSTWTLPGLATRVRHVDTGAAKLDLALSLERGADGLVGSAEYSRERFDATTVRRLLARLERLLAAAAADPELPLSRLPLSTAAERHQLLVEGNDTGSGFPRQATAASLFAARAAERPDAVALEWGGAQWSYGEVDRRSARLAAGLAAALRRLGAGPGTPAEPVVGLCFERGPELILAMLATVRAGAAYLPLDPELPAERLALMLADARVPLVVSASGAAAPLPAAVPATTLAELAALGRTAAAPPEPDPEGLAYVLYTSGSTGRSKGVAVPHRAVVRLVAGADYVRLGPADRVAQAATAAFDAATWEVWGALAAGARLVGIDRDTALDPPALAAELGRRGITALFLTTALFQLLAREAPGAFAGLSHLLFGGEACDPAAVRRALGAGRPRRLLHVYGPTETTTFATWHPVREVPPGAATVPIGRPIAASTLVLLDRRLEPLPAGAAGELYLGGEGVARGYAGRPAATAERFVPDPFAAAPGARLYRTGDRARRRADGAVEFLGRFDDQVKIRGVRIEPGEVEAALLGHPAVTQAAVTARPDRRGELRLVAYAAPAPGAPPPDGASLLRWLGARLPAALVPAAAVTLDRLPLTPSGKVDRRALPPPPEPGDAAAPAGPETPADPVTELVAAAWAEVLGVERVGAGDDFFALGGHSLLAGRVTARVRARLGVELPLSDLFAAPALADYAARVSAALAGGRRPALPPVTPRPAAAAAAGLPLSFAQERLWFLDRLEGPSPTYNVPIALRLRGALDPAALAAALSAAVARHQALSTRFALAAGGPVQVVEPPAPVALPVVDLEALGGRRAEREARRLAVAEARRPFDLGRLPLLRAALVRLGAGDHALLLTVHHVVADGGSVEVLLGELAALYGAAVAGTAAALPALAVQYPDFALWQRRVLDREALAAPIEHWRRRLAGAAPAPLPTDRPRPPRPSFEGVRARRLLPGSLGARLAGFARAAGATAFMVLLAAWQALLARWAGAGDLAVGTPVAGRPRPELEPLIGFFVDTVVVRAEVDAGRGFAELVAAVRAAALDAFAHQEVPFERLVEALRPEREIGRSPLFSTFFAYQAKPALTLSLGGVAAEPLDADPGIARFDLTLTAAALPAGGALVALDAAADLFDRTTAARLLDAYARLLDGALRDPGRPLAALDLLGKAARHQVLVEWGSEPAAPAGGPRGTVERWVAAAARRRPDAEAVVAGAVRWSYRDLDRAAGRIAARLAALGVGPETVVAVALGRSPAAIAALLGVLRAGGAYLPIDPDHPSDRRAELIAGAGARVLVTAAGADPAGAPAVLELAPGWPAGERGGDGGDPGGEPAALSEWPLPDERLAYVFFTSGSTGRPKGVAVSHRALARTLAWRFAEFAPGPGDRVLQSVPPTFDPSLWQVLGALASGAALVLPERDGDPAHLGELIARERITIADFPPSLLAALLAAGALSAPSLRLVFAGGEELPPAVAAAFRAATPARLVDIYGPTEAAIDAACWTCRGDERERVPIGRPAAGKRLRVAGAGGEPVLPGAEGELWIGGDGLARGYLGRPAATAERFRPDPAGAAPGARVYRSGDRVRHRADGALEFRGRTDRQLKLRGVRIEPGEVEAALAAHPSVAEAAVGTWQAAGGPRLAAWLVPREGAAVEPRALRAHLAARLPAHAVPAAYVRVEALPRTASGKLERSALPAPAPADLARGGTPAAPRNELERTIAGVFRELLGVDAVGIDDSFFDLGGHSLLLVAARERLAERLGRPDLELLDLFRHPTVGDLARRLAADAGAVEPAPDGAADAADAARRLREGRARQAERLARRRVAAAGESRR